MNIGGDELNVIGFVVGGVGVGYVGVYVVELVIVVVVDFYYMLLVFDFFIYWCVVGGE